MDGVSFNTPTTNINGSHTRVSRSDASQSLLPAGAFNKENISHSSNMEKMRLKREEKSRISYLGASLGRESPIQGSRFPSYNPNFRLTPTYSNSHGLYASPKHAEIDLIKDSNEDLTITKDTNEFVNGGENKSTSNINEINRSYLPSKKGREENSSPYAKIRDTKTQSKDRKESQSNTVSSFEEKASEKITIYTRILDSMKQSSPKTKDFFASKQFYNSPKNPPYQRTSIDLLTLNNEVKKINVHASSISGKLEKSNKKEEISEVLSLDHFRKRNMQREARKAQEKQNESNQNAKKEKTESTKNKQQRYHTRDKFSLTKKLTIDIFEPLNTQESEISKNNRTNSSSNARGHSNSKVYESPSILKKDFGRTCAISKNNTPTDGPLYNNFLKNIKESKQTAKIATPKSIASPASEIKKLFGASKVLSGLVTQVRARNLSQSKDSVSKEFSHSFFENHLKSGSNKSKVVCSTEPDEVKTKPLSFSINPQPKESDVPAKKVPEKSINSVQSVSPKPSPMSLKDFVTQINSGTGMPLRSGSDFKAIMQDTEKKKFTATSTKNSANKKISLNGQTTSLSRSPKITFAARTLGPARLSRDFGFNPNCRQYDQRNLVVRTEGDESQNYSEFRNDIKPISYAPPSPPVYYMTNVYKYLTGSGSDDEYFEKIYKEHFLQTFQAVNFCKYLKNIEGPELNNKKISLPKRESHKYKKTIVFDLDETLIHCNESTSMPCDAVLSIKFPHGDAIQAGINIRPHTMECLEELSKDFEIIVFTASHSCYANVALDHLDPEGKYIHHRLFRDHCITTEEGLYIKDLRVLIDRDLKDVVIVDNAVYSFGYQLENGIPIIPFYFNKKDQELLSLTSYLKSLINIKDVREVNRVVFKLHQYTDMESPEEIIAKIF